MKNVLKANSVVLLASGACSLFGENAVLAGSSGVESSVNQSGIVQKVSGSIIRWVLEHPVTALTLLAYVCYLVYYFLPKWLKKDSSVVENSDASYQKNVSNKKTRQNSH